jgi:hypothetical protein
MIRDLARKIAQEKIKIFRRRLLINTGAQKALKRGDAFFHHVGK